MGVHVDDGGHAEAGALHRLHGLPGGVLNQARVDEGCLALAHQEPYIHPAWQLMGRLRNRFKRHPSSSETPTSMQS